jgi:mono/diheme cytochrome c family protein
MSYKIMFRLSVMLTVGLTGFFTSCTDSEKVKREQYYAEGYQLYTSYCSNCHSTDGKGLGDLYPPLNRKDPLPSKELFACIVKNGISEKLVIDGKTYERTMPGNPGLTDLDIAEIATYIYNKWGTDTTYTNIYDVKIGLEKCKQ